jgi:uncharacterized protein (DUF305 family)
MMKTMYRGLAVACAVTASVAEETPAPAPAPGMHLMPDGTVMNNADMAGEHVMPDGTVMSNAEMENMHTMPDGTMMSNADMLSLEQMGMMMGCGEMDCPSTSMYMHENMEMHEGMAIEFTSDPEVDFVRGMIPHHAGAIIMCDIVRATTNTTTIDPFIDELCSAIEAGQQAEVDAMTSWLVDKGLAPETSCEGSTNQAVQMGMVMGCGDTDSPGAQLFIQENMAMHHGMAIDFTCDSQIDFVRGMIPHHDGAIVMCNIVRAAVSGDYSGMDMSGAHMMPDGTMMSNSPSMHMMPDGTMMSSEPGQHMMPDGTMMADTAMAGQHVMPNGEVMSNADMAGQHVMPNGEIMNNAEMEPMGEPEPEPELDPFIEELCSAIEAGQTDEINAMTGWLADRGLEPEAPCAHAEESCDSCCPSPPECPHDTSGDGIIGIDDLLSLLAQYGDSC